MARSTTALASLSFSALLLVGAAGSAQAACQSHNGTVQNGEACDDNNAIETDGCLSDCTVQPGWACIVDQSNKSTCHLIECGDGIVDAPEQCDTGGCCNAQCQFLSGGTTCRASGGVCDPAETCSGSDAACPDDVLSTSVCRPAAGVCDAAESCDGVNPTCPADTKQLQGTECRAVGGACDPDGEVCDGTNNACPADTFSPSTTVCRSAAGACDVAEYCTGASGDCPADAKSNAVCRPSEGVCDPQEVCDGGNDCPSDVRSTSVCRPSAGVCDSEEVCDGTSGACPVDGKVNEGTVCRDSAGVCDSNEETCDGSSNNCPADVLDSSATVCRGSQGVCDIIEHCTGSSAVCPDDSKSSAVCRASAGECDLAETCDGGNDCPLDAKSTDVCRPAVNPACDVAESCDGNGDNCPDDVLAGDCLDIDQDGIACTEATCNVDGSCSIADTCVEICRGAGFWQTHSGWEKGENIGQQVVDSGGDFSVCGININSSSNWNEIGAILEGECIRVQGVKQRQLYRQLLTAALNCRISEGGTCDQILARFLDVSFSDCNTICEGGEVDGVTERRCIDELSCFNGGGRIVDGECAKGTCADESPCGGDYGDCADNSDCSKFEDSCASEDLCSEDLDAPATICPDSMAASSPKACKDARIRNSCSIDQPWNCYDWY